MITYRLNQLPPEYGLMGVEQTLIYRLLEAGFKVKVLYEAGEIQDRDKAYHFYECEITFLGLPDIIQFINFVGKITIDLSSITMHVPSNSASNSPTFTTRFSCKAVNKKNNIL